MKPQTNATLPQAKTKVIKGKNGMFWGYIYLDGKEIEKVGGKTGYMSELNCITYLNQRVDYHNNQKNVNIPRYVKEQQNA
ncbi:hypothetical protein A6B43_00405 [Vespertiliibacter pulmonis]|uniref:Uncharacterized protein n=1 Tax=Vespertiliibacter pulmonis TaxID=1443036 RepID=A0A3N4VXH5_9PAST|nr:hypothetical protein [Vespertiliibacter pulmonis]QLB20039.1 hypothetical protein A6B43_00055 [Vespertiliibacter pulmonis]QLB20105.1 hypothetical protein A6B43_00405 [Vespertiliibacter pulmonis]RPE86073.1 hypothetical protein EDC46_0465 [Vespertiliibacter pulmonis]